jgi:hypothetical protein
MNSSIIVMMNKRGWQSEEEGVVVVGFQNNKLILKISREVMYQ